MDTSKKYDNPNPRLSANFFSKLFFWWLKPLFWYGKQNDLELKDIYNVLPKDVSELLGNNLERNWQKEIKAAEQADRKPNLYKALRKTFFWSFAYYGGWIFFLAVGLRGLQPYALGLLIWHFDPRSASTVSEAYIYASTVILIAIMMTFINHHSYLGLMEIGMRMRVASSSLIYRKVLRLSKSSSNMTTPGQIINLLSNDVARFDQLFVWLHYIWILPIQGAVIAYQIWEHVGIASLAGVFLISIQTIPLQGYMGKWASKLRLRIAVKTDERVRLMSEIIGGIQVIKMYTWEKPFEKLVCLARSYEVDILTLTSYLRGFTLATFVFTERTTLYFTVMAYVLLGNNISADKVFSMAQYFNILQATMAIFYPIAVASAAEALASIKRLEKFLMLKENVPMVQPEKLQNSVSITMKDIAASWSGDAIANTLHDITIEIPRGKLYAIVGGVGAGKSSFLHLILKELQPSRGAILVGGTVSYASQEAWLFQGSVRNNILFGQTYNKKRYNEIIKSCALTKDIQQFSHGDKTFVGDKGAMLSGGQRARINLARSVYRDADIYLLDDPLSAVDIHVGKHLFDECINGLLKNKTRILVTHQIQYLRNCDYILVLHNGRIEAQGTFAELQNQHVNFLDILSTEDSKEESETNTSNDSNGQDISLNTSKDEEDEEPQETEELMAKGNLSKSLYWKYFRAGGSILMIISFLCALILGQLGSSGTDYWVAYWTRQEEIRVKSMQEFEAQGKLNTTIPVLTIGNDSSQDANSSFTEMPILSDSLSDMMLENSSFQNTSFESIAEQRIMEAPDYYSYLDTDSALWIYGGFVITSIVMTTMRNMIFYRICMNASKNLHNLMFSCLLKAPMFFFNMNPAGRILNRFSKDVGAVDEMLPRTMIESIQIFSVMTGILIQVLIINWWTVFPMLFMGFLYWQIRNIYLRTAQDIKRLEGMSKSPVFSHVSSSLLGLTTIRSTGAEKIVQKEFDSHQDLHTGAYFLTFAASTAFGFSLDIVSVAFVAFITYSFILFDDGNTFAGNVGLAISQVLILCGMLQHGIRQTAETIAQMTSVERILQFTKLDKEGPFESEPGKEPPRDWPAKGEITFDHLYLRYTDLSPAVLKDLSIAITPGSKIGIVGRTGAGKTSLISALFNMSHLEGAIYIDGIDTQKIGLHELREKISIIPQEPVLFSATLRDNLDPFNKYDDPTIWAALDDVELKGSITSLDYHVDQAGTNFSAGERQLLCLARAVIRNNKILVLDEATANVDPITDALIQKTIRVNFKECTVLTIAHRLNTIMDSDKVLVMDHGRALEYDHPYILLQNEESHFTSMVKETGRNMFEQLKAIAKEAYESKESFKETESQDKSDTSTVGLNNFTISETMSLNGKKESS